MKKTASTLLVAAAFVVTAGAGFSSPVHAQAWSTTPVFYSQTGQSLNPAGTALSAGYYYLQNGDRVYYYGNGTYYDQTTQLYGGMVFGSDSTPVTVAGATPVFYTQTGQALNPAGSALNAGYYYLSNGVQVYYYGNGTYYNPTTQTYGGMIFGGVAVTTPTVPNTGAGGQATMNWLLLASSALVFLGGAAYVTRRAAVKA